MYFKLKQILKLGFHFEFQQKAIQIKFLKFLSSYFLYNNINKNKHKNKFARIPRLKFVITQEWPKDNAEKPNQKQPIRTVLKKGVLKMSLQSNFIEITRRHGCSPVNLLHIFRTPFPRNTSDFKFEECLKLF